MKRAAALILFVIILMTGVSQDIHFSQYRMSSVQINPAQAGFCFAKVRFAANHRSQWRSVTVPFNTFSFTTDFKLYQDRQSNNILGMGLTSYYDQAGDSKFGTSSAGGAISYLRALNDYNNHYFGIGAVVSYNDRSYDYSQLQFGSQFDGKQYDKFKNNEETFLNRGFRFYDVGIGAHWFYRPEFDRAFDAGLVYSHVNKPPQSMLNDGQITLDRKLTFYINAEILQPNKRTIAPGFYFSRQGKYTEIIAGTMIGLERLAGGYHLSNLQAGVFLRPVDAAILIFNFDYYNITFGVSYDINYSGLRKASTLRGGFELSAVYLVEKKKKKKITNIPCPNPF